MMNRMNSASRIAVVVVTAIAAVVGSVLIATRDTGEKVTTRGITATLRVPGHPGWVAVGPDALWVALNGDPGSPAGDRPLVRLDLTTGAVSQTVHVNGEGAFLTRVGETLIASVKPVGDRGFGPRRLVALDWRSGIKLAPREFAGPFDRVVQAGNAVWALQARPGTLLRLDPSSLAPAGAPIRLSSGRTLGLAAGAGYLWVTAADAGEVLRIDPATAAIRRVHVGGFPVGIVVAAANVWFADRAGGNVVRLDPDALRPIDRPIEVGPKPSWLAVAGDSLLVPGEDTGTVTRIDVHSGRTVGPPIRIAPSAKVAVAPAVTSDGESVWVSSFASNTVTRIGSSAASSPAGPAGNVTLKYTGSASAVTDGGVAGTGHFTATGAITDKGGYIDYRTVDKAGTTALIRRVTVGKKGTIVFLIVINLKSRAEPWTIISGTKAYNGLRGRGREVVDNYDDTPATFVMKGTVSR